ncbi:MAG: hypothetical protein ACE5F5_00795 [Acidimicrobiia bacterium]
MGQDVEINESVVLDGVLIVDTDRSFTGQDGYAITPGVEVDGVVALLAERLFSLDLGIDHIYVLSNTVTVRRREGWDEESAGAVEQVIHTFLRHYAGEED